VQPGSLDSRRATQRLQLGALRARAALRVHCVSTEAGFAELAMHWNRLHEETASASVFNSWLWQFQWWQVYGRGQPLRVLVAFRGDTPAGILPLYVQTEHVLGRAVRVLRPVGTGADTNPDDLGPVLAAAHERDAARALARAAARLDDGDLLLVSDLDPDSVFSEELELALRRERRPASRGCTERIAFIELPHAWDKYLGSLSANRRADIRRARRRLDRSHTARFFVWEDAGRLDEAAWLLADLHRRRWAAAGGSESFATPQYLEFHRGIISSTFARGWLRLYCLEIDGAVRAMLYCYRFRNRVFLMQGGFDPAWSACKPGTVLLSHAIEDAIGEGNEIFDFLRGRHRYKDGLATGARETIYIAGFRLNTASLLYRLKPPYVPMQRNAWRARLGRWMRARLRR
jgi:CelD/BcsL family acetyltransferase involved in cellulose biosynthesis